MKQLARHCNIEALRGCIDSRRVDQENLLPFLGSFPGRGNRP